MTRRLEDIIRSMWILLEDLEECWCSECARCLSFKDLRNELRELRLDGSPPMQTHTCEFQRKHSSISGDIMLCIGCGAERIDNIEESG